jgi:hypothetical protein
MKILNPSVQRTLAHTSGSFSDSTGFHEFMSSKLNVPIHSFVLGICFDCAPDSILERCVKSCCSVFPVRISSFGFRVFCPPGAIQCRPVPSQKKTGAKECRFVPFGAIIQEFYVQ